jgi:uncharacterized membrane protein YecN with MAPEG domain
MISNTVSASAGFLVGYFIIPIALLLVGLIVHKISGKTWLYWAAGVVFVLQLVVTYFVKI